jgi:pilus assembly protein CpaF
VRVAEVVGLEGDKLTMQDIFAYKQSGVGADGKVEGAFSPTGSVPTFLEEMKTKGITLSEGMFEPDRWT